MISNSGWKIGKRDQISDVCNRLYDRNYLVATSGNVSIRSKDGFLITPASMRKDLITAKDVVECDNSGKPLKSDKHPSSEIEMHKAVYKYRPDIGAAIHAHPNYCLACSLAEISLTDMHLPELAVYIGPVPLVPYATPGTNEMSDALKPFINDHNAFILSRHGVLVLGSDLMDAYNRLEHLEHTARVAYLVHSTGKVEPLSKIELKKLIDHAKELGQNISKRLTDFLE